jgi:hypothetical protein
MEIEELLAKRAEISAAMDKLTDQYNAQMNFWAGKVSMIEELIALQVKEQKGEEVAPDA